MKRLVATSLLLGYVTLVPFCLFGGMLMTHTDTIEMAANPAHHMHDCEMPFSGCAHTMEPGAIDTAVHHISMYLSITQTPLTALSLIVVILTLLLLVTLGISQNWLRALFLQTSPRIHARRTDEPHISTMQDILAWLSLFEASPNFA
jgi:hypothetical protein